MECPDSQSRRRLSTFGRKPVGRSKVQVKHVKTTIPLQSSVKAVYLRSAFCRMGSGDLLLPEPQTKLKSHLIWGK